MIMDPHRKTIDEHDRFSAAILAILNRYDPMGLGLPPESFTLHFEDGYSLKIGTRGDGYESFSIQPSNIFI